MSSEITEDVETSETGANEEVAAEPEKQNNFEKAFAKRLAAERDKWQKEVSEKYKDYDTHKELSEYMQEINGADAMTLKETIEMEKLQKRAEKNETTPEMQKRLETLEAKSARADELEEQQVKEYTNKLFWDAADKFAEGKDISKDDLNKFMIENEIIISDVTNPELVERKFNIAYNAMKTEEYKQQLTTAKETAVKEYLQSKAAPRVEGSGSPGVINEDTSKMGWKDINERIVARMNAANQSQ
ncbi:hypothetical protein D3C75_612730 [compost metagenome]